MAFAGGNGTSSNPYLIETPAQLNEVRNGLSLYYKLISDIDLNVPPYNTGNGWQPIGSVSLPFTGEIDFNGFKVSNLYISRGSTNFVGLFGAISGTGEKVKSGALINVTINGRNYVGALAGSLNGYVFDFFTTGSVNGGEYVGGFIGFCGSGNSIEKCSSGVIVNGSKYVGGFVGRINFGDITNCFSSGNVSGDDDYIGGFVGVCDVNASIEKCLSFGVVDGGNSEKYVSPHPNAGNYVSVGGFCGVNFGDIRNSYWDKTTSGFDYSNGGDGYTTSELKTPQIGSGIYSGWPTEIWWEINTSSYPQIYFLATYSAGTNGSISGTTSQKIPMGESGDEVTANGDTGYMFDKWSDGSTENPRKETNVFWEINVIASFTVKISTVSFTAGSNGKLSVGGVEMSTYSVQVPYGGNVDPVTIIPNENFSFLRWSDGNTDTTRTETNVTDDIIVYAIIVTDTEYEKFTDIVLNSDNTITNNISIHFFPQVLKQYKNTTIYKFLRKAIMYDTVLQNIYTENNDFSNTLPLHFNAVINNGESSDIRVYDKYDTTGTDATRDNTVFSLSKIDFTNFIYSNVIKDTSVTGFKHTDKTFNKQQVILTKALAYDGIEKKLKYIKLSGIFSNIKIYIFTDFPDDLLYNKLYKIDNEKYNDFISNKKITEIEFKRNDFEDIGTSVYGDRICDVLLDVNRDIRFKPITGRSFTLLCVCNFEPTEEIDGYVTKDGCVIRRISLIYDELPTRSKKY